MTHKLRYNATHTLSYGYFHCTACGAEFYSGGRALHEQGCTEEGYATCTYVFGPNDTNTWLLGKRLTDADKRAAMERTV